jgi:hypothetical protein
VTEAEATAVFHAAANSMSESLSESAALRLLSAIVAASPALYSHLIDAHLKPAMATAASQLAQKQSPLRLVAALAFCSPECGRLLLESGVAEQLAQLQSDGTAQSHLPAYLALLTALAYEPKYLKDWIGERLLNSLVAITPTPPELQARLSAAVLARLAFSVDERRRIC